ncbi:MAG TPA: hypothetical protein VF396_27005 [Bradyrhizobium sp.]
MAAVAVGFQSPCPRRENVCGFLWRRSNNSLVPWSGTAHFNLRQVQRGLSFANRGWVGFLKHSIFEPGEPQRANALRLFAARFLALEERVPETTKDKCCEGRAYGQQQQDRRTGFRLPRFDWRFDDYAVLFYWHVSR